VAPAYALGFDMTRVGVVDDIAAGCSTFLVEILERQETQPARLTPPSVNGVPPPGVAQATTPLERQLLGLDICQITPLQALAVLHQLQQQARALPGNGEVSA